LTPLFRDVFDAPGDTAVRRVLQLREHETVGERFIATSAAFERAERSLILIRFNAPVDPATATVAANYTLSPVAERESPIESATVDPNDPAVVRLTVASWYPIGPFGNNYAVTVRNVRSVDGRVVSESVVGFSIVGDEAFSSLRAFPQPFSVERDERLVIGGLPRSAVVEVRTSHGALVRVLIESEGSGAVVWDGRFEDGRVVPTGIYIYTASVTRGDEVTRSEVRKIAVVP
jgi:hypothetical protein